MKCQRRYGLWQPAEDGSWRFQPKDCGAWGCPACGRKQLLKVAQHLTLRAPEWVYTGRIQAEYVPTVQQALRRSGAEYLYLTLTNGGMLAVASEPRSSRNGTWRLNRWRLNVAAEALAEWSGAQPKYTWWSAGWRPAKEENLGIYIGALSFRDKAHLRAVAELAGVELTQPLKDPRDALERMRIVLKGDDAPEVAALLEKHGGLKFKVQLKAG